MKPVSLTIKGFRSHERETELSFAGRRLFAIVGPTGAGKSSILDAVAYSLYGATPRIRRNVKKLICSHGDSAHVRFVFEVEGNEYEVTRSLRRSGPGEHVLVDRSSGQRVIGEGKVTDKITDLLGLDFDAFCSSVLLAQGKFSEFLEAPPTARSRILKGVFRLDQIDALREEAKSRRNELDGEVKRVEGRRAHIPDDVEERLARAVDARAGFSKRVAVLEKAVPQEKKMLGALERSAEALAAALASLQVAADALKRCPDVGELEELASAAEQIDGPLATATEALAIATSAKTEAEKKRTQLERRLGERAALIETRVKSQALAHGETRLETHAAAVTAGEAGLEKAAAALTEAEAFEQQALDSLEKTRREREDIERAHQAHVLRDALKVGDPCPVCEQTISSLPRGDRPAELAAVRKSETEAKTLHERAIKATRAASTAMTAAEGELAAALKRLAEEEAALKEARAVVTATLGTTTAPLEEVTDRLARLEEAESSVSAASVEIERARSDLERWSLAKRSLDATSAKIVARLSHVAGALKLSPPDPEATVAGLTAAAETMREAAETSVRGATAEAEAARAAENETEAALGKLRASLELDLRASVETSLRDAIRTATEAEGEEKTLLKQAEEAKALVEQERQLKDTLALYLQLADDMRDENFIRFMLEEKRKLLSDIGSERLREMTRRYRFDDRGDFKIVDELDADKERTVDTLSGGETFLASLALSLALAEAVTRHGGRLQCFFLDEGFGSLDAEALDNALEGIEHIVTEDRLIGLVSHVEALRNRVEDKIVLDKDESGMTRVIAGATLG